MATIKAFIRSTVKNKPANVRIRLTDGRDIQLFGKTNLQILPEYWNPDKEEIKNRIILPDEIDRDDFNDQIKDLKKRIKDAYDKIENKSNIPDSWLKDILSSNPNKLNVNDGNDIIALFDEYINDAKVGDTRRKHIVGVRNMFDRYLKINNLQLDIDSVTTEHITAFEKFLFNEHIYQGLYPSLYESTKFVKKRGQNTVTSKLKMLSPFFTWINDKKISKNNPFYEFEFVEDVYADPFFLLPEELDHLYKYKGLPKSLELIRDLFCLQCMLGCRVGDFIKRRKDDIHDDVLIYVAEKTVTDNARTVYVPILDKAKTIIDRYNDPEGRLMPFINVDGRDGYNKKIKELLSYCKIERPVIVIDSHTRKPVSKRLCDVASTHTARKTFINSNYIETQDPKLISMMSGHSENSRAFSRYRKIDIDMLRNQMESAFNKKKKR